MADHPRICDMLLRWEEAKAAGNPLSAEELCPEEPELVPLLQYRIGRLEAMDLVLAGEANPASAATLVGPEQPEPAGDIAPGWQPPGYQIVGVLGRGGMGVVYKARQIGLDRLVALKTIPATAMAGSDALTRFDIEARAVARLRHPHIVQIYDVGTYAGCPFFAFELMDGGNLAQLLQAKSLDIREAARVAEVLARAVHYAHTRGIIHRDLKPSNVLMYQGENGPDLSTAKLGDFGLARLRDSGTSSHLTHTGTTLGTPSYMAPEQAQGQVNAIGPATDVYGLGAVLYEMLCGKPPFHGDSDWMTIHQVVSGALEPVHTMRPDCPQALEAICLQCLAKNPLERYATAEAVAADLRRFLDGQPVQAHVAGHGRISRRTWLASAAATAATIATVAALQQGRRRGPVKVGVIQSQTEFLGDTGQAVINATLFAIDEINRAGGLLGRALVPIVSDGQSDEMVFASKARRMLADDGVTVLFACITSSHRRAVEAVAREYDRLLFYPGESEGLDQSPYVIGTGPLPNQQILPAVAWFQRALGKRRFFLVGSDTVYARAVRAILGDAAAALSVEIVGESYVDPSDVLGWAMDCVAQIEGLAPDALVTVIQGKANLAFIHRLRTRKITPQRMPTLSCTFTEHDLRNILEQMAGDYLCGHYYQGLKEPANARFIARLRADRRFGETPVVSDAMVAAYVGVHLWGSAVARSGTFDDLTSLRRALGTLSMAGPGGPVRIDPVLMCDAKFARVAQVRADKGISIVWSSPDPLKPVIYPTTRTHAQWDELIQTLHAQWGGHWSLHGALRDNAEKDLPHRPSVRQSRLNLPDRLAEKLALAGK